MKIQKLPAETRSKLQSGIIVTDAAQCVMELVHNSLDADATGVAVRIDVKSYQIQVIDNGRGIKKDDLEFVGERFMTTKYQSFVDLESSFPTYGFRGQALSSLQDVSSSLTIETKSEDNGPTLVKIFKNNKALPITEIVSKRNGTGTSITIEDFMYTMPVRRIRISEMFDLEEIKKQLQYLAIIHFNVCFTLRNENKGLILLQTSQASNILDSLTNIFGKTLVKSLKAVNYTEKNYKITGYISLKPQSQNNLQLLYLNKRIVTKGVIHKFINNTIKDYRGKKTSLSKPTALEVLKDLRSSYNAYIIQIKCPHSYYELFTNLGKTTVEFTNWKDVLKCIHKAMKRTFKNNLNLDSSCNTQNGGDKNTVNEDNECKRGFGTSFLVNAVKGNPVKRGLNAKQNIKMGKKIKRKGTGGNSDILFSKYDKKQDLNLDELFNIEPLNDDIGSVFRGQRPKIRSSFDDSFYSNKTQGECTNDSLESPIPKKKFKCHTNNNLKVKNPQHFNQSFIEFYEWLKKKFQTDTNAFNLYSDFLKFRNKPSHPKEVSDIRSSVSGGKLKKQVQKIKKLSSEKSSKQIDHHIPALDEEMAVITQRQLKILPRGHVRMKKAVHFTSKMNEFPKTLNLSYIFGENLNFENCGSSEMFKKPQGSLGVSNNQRQFGYNQTRLSLPSSEAHFTNVLSFRNHSESFFHQSSFIQNEIMSEKTLNSGALNSWSSHYQTFMPKSKAFFERNRNEKNYTCWPEANKKNKNDRSRNREDIKFYNLPDSSLCFSQFSNKMKEANVLRDVEIQVNILENVVPIQKVNAFVQTLQAVSGSSSFENSCALHKASIDAAENFEVNVQEHQLLENNLSREVPNPDFWNTSAHLLIEAEFASNADEAVIKNSKSQLMSERHSTSSGFICGQKSLSNTNLQNEKSSSKETQTLAIWTDSLTELGTLTELPKETISDSKSEDSQLPKTLPLREIKSDIPRPVSGFYLTERYDFVPKGLSPQFLNVETADTLILSPREKDRIKLTIDNTQNDLLANVKWQAESTVADDCLKPTIPEGILFEMRQKAGKCAMVFENPVLSASLSYCAVKIQNLLHSFAFTKEVLTSLEILGQLDRKFIVTLIKISAPKKMELISLFDQHAVDERIKLEELLKENLSPDGKFISSLLDSPVECVLTDFNVRIFSDLKEKMLDFGLVFENVNENTVSVIAVPTFLLKKHEKDLKSKKAQLSDLCKSLISNIMNEVTETKGAVSKIPKIIHNAFCLEACHRAVKFNKTLTIESMTGMISKLQNCKLPFQCAHGRPSVIPIIDLEDFKPAMEIDCDIDLEGLRRFYNQRNDITENSESVLPKN